MTGRAVAGRYARALFDVASKERAELTVIEAQLAEFEALVAGNEELRRILSNPAIPTARKRAVVDQLAARGRVSPILAKLLGFMAGRDRLTLLPDVLSAFRQRLMEHSQIVRAELVTAIPLTADRLAALEQGLARATGRQVQLEARVDPSIIGGAVARVGSTVYDGSVTTQLQKLRQSLANAAE